MRVAEALTFDYTSIVVYVYVARDKGILKVHNLRLDKNREFSINRVRINMELANYLVVRSLFSPFVMFVNIFDVYHYNSENVDMVGINIRRIYE